jgi:hypothetical protein
MRMRIAIGLLLILPVVAAEPEGYKYWSASQLKSYARPLTNKSDPKASLENLDAFGATDHAAMVHREASGLAEQHQVEADLMVIVSGSGELLVGGTMRDGKTTAPDELRGPSIDGATRQKLAPGDIVHIAPKIPHQVLLDGAPQITYFVLKVKE